MSSGGSGSAARSLWQVFRWPTALALLSLAGLLAALVGDGIWDAFGWAALALPVALCARALWLAARRR